MINTKKSNTPNNWDAYKSFRNRITTEIRKSKKKFQIDRLSERLTSSETGPKDLWKTLNNFIKPDQANVIPPLNKDGTIYAYDTAKANALNDFFAEQTHLNDSSASLPQTINVPDYNLDSLSVTVEEVESTLRSLPLGKAAGPDLINNRLLKELSQPLSYSLCDLF